MADRMTPTQAGGDKPMGEEPEAMAASAVLDDLESLRNRGSAAEQQRDEYLALLQRTRADYENYQKRVQRDQAEERRSAHAAFARDLLPVVDSLQRALDAARQEIERSPLAKGVDLVRSQLLDIFGRYGITPIDALGQPFDPIGTSRFSSSSGPISPREPWSRSWNPVTPCTSGSSVRPRSLWPRRPILRRASDPSIVN